MRSPPLMRWAPRPTSSFPTPTTSGTCSSAWHGTRTVLVPCHALEHVPEVVGVGKDEVGRGAHRMSGGERILPLVEFRIVPARGEGEEAIAHSGRGFRLVAPNLPNERYDRRGIDSTAQTTARADVADQVRSRRVQ